MNLSQAVRAAQDGLDQPASNRSGHCTEFNAVERDRAVHSIPTVTRPLSLILQPMALPTIPPSCWASSSLVAGAKAGEPVLPMVASCSKTADTVVRRSPR